LIRYRCKYRLSSSRVRAAYTESIIGEPHTALVGGCHLMHTFRLYSIAPVHLQEEYEELAAGSADRPVLELRGRHGIQHTTDSLAAEADKHLASLVDQGENPVSSIADNVRPSDRRYFGTVCSGHFPGPEQGHGHESARIWSA